MTEYDPMCQVDAIKSEPPQHSLKDKMWIEVKDLLRKMKRLGLEGWKRVRNRGMVKESAPRQEEVVLNLQPGERVRVKSAEEIRRMLDDEGKFRGTLFTAEMWQYCGQEFTVFKRVNLFLDERTNKIRKIRNTVLLRDAYCSGKRAFGERCDRSCFLFWKEAWLERVEK